MHVLLLIAGCGSKSGDDTGPADTGDPPPACEGGPYAATDCGLHEDIDDTWNYRRFQNDDGGIDAIIVREPVGSGPGETTEYALRGFGLVKDGCLTCVSDDDALSYTTGHHNWMDDADALIEGVVHRVHMQYQPEDPDDYTSPWVWSYWLEGVDPATDDRQWGAIDLELTEGAKW